MAWYSFRQSTPSSRRAMISHFLLFLFRFFHSRYSSWVKSIEASPDQLESTGLLPSSPPSKTTQVSSSNSKGTRAVFALIIGINDYRALPPLRGAVNDARAFEKYLLDSYDDKGLQVPPQNILLIENENATRSAILDAFKSHFLENKSIPDHGEATMIFFFAGHGGRVLATGNRMSRDYKVGIICPVDERTVNDAGEYVHGIPDYVLGRLLWLLAQKKGRNITVILDSCGSNSWRAPTAIPPDLDNHLWAGDADTAQHYLVWRSTVTSHVLLAACRTDEFAREDYQGIPRGRFTRSLINLLRWAPLTTTTYKELMSRTEGWSEQHPRCGGRTNRLIFDGNYPATGRRAVLLKPQNPPRPGSTRIPTSSELFSVAMGAVEGVVPGTEFSAHDANNKFLCTFVAQTVELTRTNLVAADSSVPVGIRRWSRAVVSDWKNQVMILRVHTPTDFRHTTHLFPKISRTGRLPSFVQAKADDAHLIIRTDEEHLKIVLEWCEGTTMRKVQREIRFPLGNPAHLPDAMDGVAHFNYFLERSNKEDPLLEVLPNGVMVPGFALEMHRLLGDFPTRKPDSSVGQNGNMVIDGAVRFASEEGARYGFTICNTSPEDLYPCLFYFDPETFTIQHWYLPEVNVQAPLPSGKRLTIGMGGEHAFKFTLSDGQEESSGFLKLFVAREYVDLERIEQRMSPFHPEFVGPTDSSYKLRGEVLPPCELTSLREVLPSGELASPRGTMLPSGTRRHEMEYDRLNYSTWDVLTVTLTITR